LVGKGLLIQMNNEQFKYSIKVYEDYAVINGWLTYDVLILLVSLFKKEGFTHLTSNDGITGGFKMVRKNDN
jgi:hypothetical protein